MLLSFWGVGILLAYIGMQSGGQTRVLGESYCRLLERNWVEEGSGRYTLEVVVSMLKVVLKSTLAASPNGDGRKPDNVETPEDGQISFKIP